MVIEIKLCQTIDYLLPNKCLIIDDEEENAYDYEIIDEEVIQMNKHKIEFEGQIKRLQKKIELGQKEISILQGKIDNLN